MSPTNWARCPPHKKVVLSIRFSISRSLTPSFLALSHTHTLLAMLALGSSCNSVWPCVAWKDHIRVRKLWRKIMCLLGVGNDLIAYNQSITGRAYIAKHTDPGCRRKSFKVRGKDFCLSSLVYSSLRQETG